MYDNQIKDKFVELRAAGKSFGDISQELGVVKSTLHRWEDERADDISRLRRVEWEDHERRAGRTLEDLMVNCTCKMIECESRLEDFEARTLNFRETMTLLRDSRREYFRLRAMLMGAPQRARKTSASNLESGDTKSNETERFDRNCKTEPRNTNDLLQSGSKSFDFCPPPESETSLNPQPPTLNQTQTNPSKIQPFPHQEQGGSDSDPNLEGEAPRREPAEGSLLPRGEGRDEGQTGFSTSAVSTGQSEIQNPQSKMALMSRCDPSEITDSLNPQPSTLNSQQPGLS